VPLRRAMSCDIANQNVPRGTSDFFFKKQKKKTCNIYIYIYIERERERENNRPPT